MGAAALLGTARNVSRVVPVLAVIIVKHQFYSRPRAPRLFGVVVVVVVVVAASKEGQDEVAPLSLSGSENDLTRTGVNRRDHPVRNPSRGQPGKIPVTSQSQVLDHETFLGLRDVLAPALEFQRVGHLDRIGCDVQLTRHHRHVGEFCGRGGKKERNKLDFFVFLLLLLLQKAKSTKMPLPPHLRAREGWAPL